MAFASMLAAIGSDPRVAIIVAIGAVILLDASKQHSAFEEGIVRPIPPILAGSARSERSASEQDGRPVVAGMNFSRKTRSRGSKRWPIPGIVLEIYAHLLACPCM